MKDLPQPPTSAEPHLWFGYLMGVASGARDAAEAARVLAGSPLLSADDRQTFLVCAYACDLQHDQCLMQAIGWGSR